MKSRTSPLRPGRKTAANPADARVASLLPLAAAALILAACGEPAPEVRIYSGATMGTTYNVSIADGHADGSAVADAIATELDDVNRRMSTWLDDSELSRFNASASTDWQPVSASLCELIELALEISAGTGGAFDITVLPLVDLWGFGADGGVASLPSAADVAAVRERTGYAKLATDCSGPALRKTRSDLEVDLSAIAKGYGVDRVAERLEALGFANYLIEVGGELRVRGTKRDGAPWRIGLERPEAGISAVQTGLELSDTGVATSGDYRNYYEVDGDRYSHTIDPTTGAPVRHTTASVTVLAPRAVEADALATALLVMGAEEGLSFAEARGISALFLDRRGSEIHARSTPAFTEIVRSSGRKIRP